MEKAQNPRCDAIAKAQSESKETRYERKFFVSELTKHEIELIVKLNPAMFSEIYQQRFVNNLYFDSPNMDSYSDAVDGSKARIKVRIRWYGDLFGLIHSPVLELKIKEGLIGRKERFPLIPFLLDESFQLDTIGNVFKGSSIPNALKLYLVSLEVSLLNRYSRRYFQSADRKYRLTVDSDMAFYRVNVRNNTFLHRSIDLLSTVVELKYGLEEDQGARRISSRFPFRMTKSSKYVNGIENLYLY